MTIAALAPLDRYPAQTIFTFVDLGPRLITLTHHDAIAGPYHRNGDAILDVQHAFGRSPDEARARPGLAVLFGAEPARVTLNRPPGRRSPVGQKR